VPYDRIAMIQVEQEARVSNLINRKTFKRSGHLIFVGTVLSDDIENQLARFHKETDSKDPLLFDFEQAEFIDIPALVNCIATLVQRKENNLETFLGYPKAKKTRDFFDIWRFAEAVNRATGNPFELFLLPEDRHYLSEQQESYRGVGDGIDALEYNPDWDDNPNSKRNFFEFTTFSSGEQNVMQTEPLLAAPRNESKRWTGALIRQVLMKHLGSETPKDDIARVVIYEAISNAVRHPKAHIIQVVSHFARKAIQEDEINTKKTSKDAEKNKLEGSLRICVWDDGDSISSTLLNAVKAGKNVRAFRFPVYMYDAIHVRVKNFEGAKLREIVVNQSEDLTADSTEARVLLSSLYPGISRAVDDAVPPVEPYENAALEEPSSYLDWMPGMGLYSLAKTVLDQYQGSLFIRSGNYRLLMEIAHDAYRVQHKVHYKCTITSYPNVFPMFRGNLITIKLPIKGIA
jgi:hypothetical protein